MTESDDERARRLLRDVLNGDLKWTPDMRLRIATVCQVYASLAILDALRRRNDQVESFQREVLRVLEKITSEGPSGAGATAQVVEKEGP
jgi:hypothetical protein